MEIKSQCIFCGMGCRLVYETDGTRITRVRPDPSDPVSRGRPCPKGLFIHTLSPKRTTKPLARSSSGFDEVSWEYALELVKDKLDSLDPRRTGWIGSGEITNEDNYAIAKFARELGSENIDSCARLCHSPTVDVFNEMLGIPASPGRLDEIRDLDTILLVGTNPGATYPVMFQRILESRSRKAKLLVYSPFEDETSANADLTYYGRLDYAPFFLLGVLDILLETLTSDIPGFDRLVESVRSSRKIVKKLFSRNVLEEFAGRILESRKLGIAHGMGVTQTYNGLDTIRALVSIALLKHGTIITNRGKVNIQGCGDVGVYPGPGGKTLTEFLLLDPVDFVFMSIFNPAVSMPDLESTRKVLKKAFIVQAMPYFNETSEYADIILPTPLLYERAGTITTGENRVRLVRKVLKTNALQEWQIFTKLGNWDYKSVRDVTEEIVKVVPRYQKVNPELAYSGVDQFTETEINPRFVRINPRLKSWEDYPFILVTWRKLPQFNTGDLTNTSQVLNSMFSSRAVVISERDALKLGIRTGDKIVLESPAGSLEAEVKVGYGKIPQGIVVASFHFSDFPVNVLTPRIFNESMTPSYKTVPVRIRKI